MPSNERQITEQAKFAYYPLGKAFEKQTKTIADQGEKQIKAIEEHGQQLVESNEVVKKTKKLLKNVKKTKKKIFNELVEETSHEFRTLKEKN